MGSRGKTALLLGSTGETGKELLRELVHSSAFDKVRYTQCYFIRIRAVLWSP